MERNDAMAHQVAIGTEVRSADDEKLGKVVAIDNGFLVVEKGFFFPTDYHIPTSAIATYDGDRAYLSMSKDEALNSNWSAVTVDDYETTTVDAVGTSTSMAGNREAGWVEGGGAAGTSEVPFSHHTHAEAAHIDTDDRLVVPVHEEELTATKHAVERGQVRIEKDVIAEERTLEVPVTEERVTVQRRTVDRPVAAGEIAFAEDTIDVPIRGEEVDLQKQVRVAEEVEIAKEAVARTERVSGTVRREEVYVDENSGIRTDAEFVDPSIGTLDDATGRSSGR